MLHSIHSRRLLCIFLVHYAQVVLHIGHGPMTRHLKKKIKRNDVSSFAATWNPSPIKQGVTPKTSLE